MSYTDKLNAMKEKSGMTNQQIAEVSKIPIGTVSRIFSGQTEDPSFSTLTSIIKAMNGSVDELIGIERTVQTASETKIIHADERLIALYDKTIRDKNTWITLLFGVLAAVLIAIIALFIYDFTHLDRGWYQEALAKFYTSLDLGGVWGAAKRTIVR